MKKYISIVICLLLVGCSSSDQKSETSDFLGNYKKIKKEYRVSEGFNQCMVSSLNGCHESEVNNNAQKSGNILVCDELSNKDAKNRCVESIKFVSAIEENDEKKCLELGEQARLNCIYSIVFGKAIENLDIETCDEIMLEKYTNDIDDELKKEYANSKNNCYDQVYNVDALRKLDIKICDEIKDLQTIKSCKQRVEEQAKLINESSNTENSTNSATGSENN